MCRDQNDPTIAAKGLLGNFLDRRRRQTARPAGQRRRQGDVPSGAFGPERAKAVWQALEAKGWIVPDRGGRQFSHPPIRRLRLCLLQRAVGALCRRGHQAQDHGHPRPARGGRHVRRQRQFVHLAGQGRRGAVAAADQGRSSLAALRRDLEHFLDKQQEGYAHLYDAKAGMFSFGWDATREQFLGWEDAEGNWHSGHMDYLVNEFRGPAEFVVLRFGLPADAVRTWLQDQALSAGRRARDAYVLAPWEGSAFQGFGLGLCMDELRDPAGRKC